MHTVAVEIALVPRRKTWKSSYQLARSFEMTKATNWLIWWKWASDLKRPKGAVVGWGT